jgi:hypothetical protein
MSIPNTFPFDYLSAPIEDVLMAQRLLHTTGAVSVLQHGARPAQVRPRRPRITVESGDHVYLGNALPEPTPIYAAVVSARGLDPIHQARMRVARQSAEILERLESRGKKVL